MAYINEQTDRFINAAGRRRVTIGPSGRTKGTTAFDRTVDPPDFGREDCTAGYTACTPDIPFATARRGEVVNKYSNVAGRRRVTVGPSGRTGGTWNDTFSTGPYKTRGTTAMDRTIDPPDFGREDCTAGYTACTPIDYKTGQSARAKGGRVHNAAVSPWPPDYNNASGRRRVTVGPSGRTLLDTEEDIINFRRTDTDPTDDVGHYRASGRERVECGQRTAGFGTACGIDTPYGARAQKGEVVRGGARAFGIDYGGDGVMRNASGCNAQYSNQVGPSSQVPKNTFEQRMRNFRCQGLESRRNVLADKLNTLRRQGSNPQWQDQLKYKIDVIDNEMNRKRC